MLTLLLSTLAFAAGCAFGVCLWPALRLRLLGPRSEIERLGSRIENLEKLAKGVL